MARRKFSLFQFSVEMDNQEEIQRIRNQVIDLQKRKKILVEEIWNLDFQIANETLKESERSECLESRQKLRHEASMLEEAIERLRDEMRKCQNMDFHSPTEFYSL